MMSLGLTAAQKVVDRLSSSVTGVAAHLALPADLDTALPAPNVLISSFSPEVLDKNLQLTYPRLAVSAAAVTNSQIERYMPFSGVVTLSIDVQVSSDQLALLEALLHVYVESTARVLESSLGDWGDGIHFGGRYEIRFASPKEAGFGFAQSAKFSFDVNASRS